MTDDEAGDLRQELAELRQEVAYGRGALAAAKELRDETMRHVDGIERLVALIRRKMGDAGDA